MKSLKVITAVCLTSLAIAVTSCKDDEMESLNVDKVNLNQTAPTDNTGSGTGTNPPPCSDCD